MTIGLLERKAELIERVAERVRERLEADHVEASERFVRLFYAHVAPGDVVHHTPDDLLGSALCLWQLGQTRQPRAPRLSVYTPSVAEHGWHSMHTIVEIVTDDMPFLFESVTAFLNEQDAEVHLVIHPIVEVTRDAEGQLTELRPRINGGGPGIRESFMHIQVSEQLEDQIEPLRLGIERILADVRAAVEDFPAMHVRCREVAAELDAGELDASESIAFLHWLLDDHFTFVGCRRYRFDGDRAVVEPGTGLGVLRPDLAGAFQGLLTGGRRPVETQLANPLRITKASRRSTVHRPVRLDTIGIQRRDADGRVIGEHLFIGLLTSRAYGRSPREIPILRRKVADVLERTEFHEDSYNYKTLVHILDTYPRDELFQISAEDLYEISVGILNLQERPQIAYFPRLDPFGRFVSCLVFVPRDRYDTALRLRFQHILETAYEGRVSTYYTNMSDEAHARLHFIIDTKSGTPPNVDRETVQDELIEAGRSWQDHLRDELISTHGESVGLLLWRQFGTAFGSGYRDQYSPATAVSDIEAIREALGEAGFAQNLYRPIGAEPSELRYKICALGEAAPLSDILPVLENMGLRVRREVPFRIRPAEEARPVWLREFELYSTDGRPPDLATARDAFHEAFALVRSGEMENDGFNQLVLRAGLSARQVTILRAYCKYLRQIGITFSQKYMEQTLADNADVACWLVALFEARFDPAAEGDRDVAALELVDRIHAALEAVSNLDEDRILRAFLTVFEATLRTNHYQPDEHGVPRPYLAIKLDSLAIPRLPKPRPVCEIFVYSSRMEGIHLRGGRVARGGIRWSDRREDFRREVLGLMKAQMVKNTVIVPVGSKGGFVVKQPPSDREALRAEVVACYQTLISALLDLTDNIVDTHVVPPRDVVRRDGNDPYLVVAADKGTATFSDTANDLSTAYGFWLDDAFASGGSAGYDHKDMGITARGAWESVKRHFREMGKDIQKEDFTVAGVGDMSGDVFGNGMLLSDHIQLTAAFNHMHIFVDPTPEAASSLAERQRLFDLSGSTWGDYKAELISAGGGVWPRSKKSIPVSAEMQALLGIESDSLPPTELIQAILKSPVELLWFGGIGTYVRDSAESDASVGDRANDAVRVEAAQLRAHVIGEGANLAMTQKARVEFDLRGGRLFTDFIDNSAGVDCSDHEVNIKILLREVERSGDITRKQRDALLESMTDEVGELVLRDNYLQTQSLSVTHQVGAHLLDRLGRFMRSLEKERRLDRKLEGLPNDEELIERFARGISLTRPELCTLMAYSKLTLYDELLHSDLPDDPSLADDLRRYFPTPLQERCAEAIPTHRLRREIVATIVTNEMINRAGISFVREVGEKTGHPACDVARAYLVCRAIFNMNDVFAEIEALDNQVPAAAQAALVVECGRLLDRGTVWVLRHAQKPFDVEREIEAFRDGITEVGEHLGEILGSDQKQTLQMRVDLLESEGAPAALAQRIARRAFMVPACAIVLLAHDTDVPVTQVAHMYFRVGSRFGFNWLRRAAQRLPSDTAWDKLAVTALVDDLESSQLQLARRIMAAPGGGRTADGGIDAWSEVRRLIVARASQLLGELQAQPALDYQMLAVASRQLSAMIS